MYFNLRLIPVAIHFNFGYIIKFHLPVAFSSDQLSTFSDRLISNSVCLHIFIVSYPENTFSPLYLH